MHFIELLKRWHNNFPCTQKDLFFIVTFHLRRKKAKYDYIQFEILHKYTELKIKGKKLQYIYMEIYIYMYNHKPSD